uniref:Uncharacterized protein n=1 Tax=Oryza rufipogon TaxID=4529 RepID=A0A0E0QKF3_ORYRU
MTEENSRGSGTKISDSAKAEPSKWSEAPQLFDVTGEPPPLPAAAGPADGEAFGQSGSAVGGARRRREAAAAAAALSGHEWARGVAPRVRNSSEKLHMGTIKLTCTLSNPKEVSRTVVIEARCGILTILGTTKQENNNHTNMKRER